MLKCREVVSEADQLLDGTLSWRKKLAIKLHLLLCHHCRRYVRQLGMLVRAIPNMYGKASEAETRQIMASIRDRVNLTDDHPD